MARNKIFEASPFPFDAVSLSYFVRSTCLLRTFNVFTSYDQRAYFVRSTCLLRTINVLTSYEVRQTHQMFWENSSDFLAKSSDLPANSSDFLANTSELLTNTSDILANSSDFLANTCGETCLFMRANTSYCLMCLSYFGRSTCLLRPINVLTSAVQRAYFGRSKTDSSDFLAKHIGHFDENNLISC